MKITFFPLISILTLVISCASDPTEQKKKPTDKRAMVENNYSGFRKKEVDQIINESEFFLPHIMRAVMGDNQEGSVKYKNLLRKKGYSLLGESNLQPVGDSNPYKTTSQKYGRYFSQKGYFEVFQTPEIIEGKHVISPYFGRSFCVLTPENELLDLWKETFLLFKKQGGEPTNDESQRSIINSSYYYKWEFTTSDGNESGTTELSKINKGCFSIITCMEIADSATCEKYKTTYEEMVRKLILDSLKSLDEQTI